MRKLVMVIILHHFFASSFAQDIPHTILWEVSKPGIPHTSYLFGTFHEVNPGFFSSLKNTVNKLEATSTVYVELTSADATATARQKDALQTWDMNKWNSILDTARQQVFYSFVQKAANPDYYKLPPLTLFLTLFRIYAQNFCDTSFNNGGELMDNYIEKKAAGLHKPVYSLDTSHMAVLVASPANNGKDSGYIADGIQLMDKMLHDDASDCALISTYKNFQLDYQFEKTIAQGNALALLERNNSWVNILDNAFAANSCFVAVGFRHLMYRQGLIRQLQLCGYTVKPMAPM